MRTERKQIQNVQEKWPVLILIKSIEPSVLMIIRLINFIPFLNFMICPIVNCKRVWQIERHVDINEEQCVNNCVCVGIGVKEFVQDFFLNQDTISTSMLGGKMDFNLNSEKRGEFFVRLIKYNVMMRNKML